MSTTAAEPDFGDVSGVVLAHLLGPVLADLDSVPDSPAGDGQLMDLASDLHRLEAWAVAQRARVLGVARDRALITSRQLGSAAHADGHGTRAGRSHSFDDELMVRRMVGTDLSLALGVSTWEADHDLDLAAGLRAHPALGRALSAGRLDRRRIELVLEEVSALTDPADRDTVIRRIVGNGHHPVSERVPGDLIRELRLPGRRLRDLTSPNLRRAVRRECAGLEPEAMRVDAAFARAQRDVVHRDRRDAMGELVVTAARPATTAAFSNIDSAARALRAQGDSRSLDQLRTDVALGWLTEGAFGTLVTRPAAPPTAVPSQRTTGSEPSGPADRVVLPRPRAALIVVAMSAATALGCDDAPATLYGPGGASCIPADVAREIAFEPGLSSWRRLLYDERTGIACDVSTSYAPPPRLSTFVRLRDGFRSRVPTSDTWRVELDHVTRYDHEQPERGGATTSANLACEGARDHHLKTDGALRISGDANGPLDIETHSGHRYRSWPEQWGDPAPPF